MNVDIVTILWGRQFVDVFTSFCLPSLMSEGNLPQWPFSTRYVLFTTLEDASRIQKTQIYKRLSTFIEFDFQTIQAPGILANMKFILQAALHGNAVNRAIQENRAVIFISPDNFFCKNALNTLNQYISQGYEVLMTVGPRVELEHCFDELLQRQNLESCSLPLTSFESVDLFLKYTHPNSQISFLDNELFMRLPSHVYFRESHGRVRLQAFHMHPFFLKHPVSMEGTFTYESDYMQKFDHQRDKIAVLNHQEFVMLGLEWGEYELDALPIPFELRAPYIQQYAEQHCSPVHQWFFSQPIYWSSEEALTSNTKR